MGKVALKHVLKNFLNHFETLESRHKSNNEDDLYHKEFQSLKELTESLKKNADYGCTVGSKDVNIRKNRYKDILPYDFSRVILSDYPGVPGSSYINASYVKGSTGSTCYIACQGPLPNTVVDFYRMIWECEITVIVMACNETESGRFKCECYWPENTEQSQQYGNVTVSLVKWKQVCPDFLVRTLKIKSNNEERVICQFHYLSWPDHSIPPSVGPILELVRLIRDVQASEARPILVHCSAGCGRTGTICSIDYVWALLRSGKLKEDFSLYQIIADMRRQRIAMVQTKEQYILAYRAVATLFKQQLKMIDAHTYENLNEDGEPLINSDENELEEEDTDTVDKMSTSEEKEIESPQWNSEEDESNYHFKPDLIKKRRKNYFDGLKQSRLHKSTPDFDLFQPINTDQNETTTLKQNEKLVGKATVIRRSNRPSIAHLKAMFENLNMPNPSDGFMNNYNNKVNNRKGILKRSMSTREKVGHSNTWSTANIFGMHGSFENLNYFKDDTVWKTNTYNHETDSNDESIMNEDKDDKDPFYELSFNNHADVRANENQYIEPIYGFKKETVDEIDKEFIIENIPVDLPPPKPPRTYQQNDEFSNEQTFQKSDSILNSNNQLNQIMESMPTYLMNSNTGKMSTSKNYYNTIGPIKHRDHENRTMMMPCFNVDMNYLKAYQNQTQSKSTYNLHMNMHSKESPLVTLFDPPVNRSVSIDELSNNNLIYENANQRFGILSNYKNPISNPLPINAAPLPNHLKQSAQIGVSMKSYPSQQQQQDPQDFYGYIGNNLNHPTKTLQPNRTYQQDAYKINAQPTLPKPNIQQPSNTLPAHYSNQLHQQQNSQHISLLHHPQSKVPMSYVKPMRNTSTMNVQLQGQQYNNMINQTQQQLSIPVINISTNVTNKYISNGNLKKNTLSNEMMNSTTNSNMSHANIPNSASSISLCKVANNFLPHSSNTLSSVNQSNNTQRIVQTNFSKQSQTLNGKMITVNQSKGDTPSTDAYQLNAKLDTSTKQQSIIKQNEVTDVKMKKKSSAFNAITSIFGLGKRKKDKKTSSDPTGVISTHSINVPNNGNLIRPPHSHRFKEFQPPAQWTQV